jgi:uncharacterized protein (TIGR03067 family)
MRCQWLIIPAVALLSAADAAQKPQRDGDRIQGTWTVTSSEREGKKEPGTEKDPLQLEFAADTFRFLLPAGARHKQPYKLDPSKKPKTIDWLDGGKNGPSKPLLGIYELDGDTLKICWGKEGGERPQEFQTKAGTEDWLWILKRTKRE